MELFGKKLREVREEKKYTVDQVARDTRISKRYIIALENEDFSIFPGETYLIGFLRSYAEYLELNPDHYVNLYKNLKIQEQPIPFDELLDKKRKMSPVAILLLSLVGVGIICSVFLLIYFNVFNKPVVQNIASKEEEIPVEQRPELDRWIISLLNSLVYEVGDSYENYEPTRAGRAISEFVTENLSNWFVRLSRKRYWGGEYCADKISAYQTLYRCIATVAKLMAPIAPFYADMLYTDLNSITGVEKDQSVHLAEFPQYNESFIDKDLEEKMSIAQKASSMILALRRKEKLKVRQPLTKIMVPLLSPHFKSQFDAVKDIILTEVNVKEVEYLEDTLGFIKKKIKPDFKKLGPKYGKMMKNISAAIAKFDQSDISELEQSGKKEIMAGEEKIILSLNDVEILTEDIPGWTVATEGQMTIALDINITEELKQEGIAREFINKIQNLRKESNFEVTDRINIKILKHDYINDAVINYRKYICDQTLALDLQLVESISDQHSKEVGIDNDVVTEIVVEKCI